MFPAFLSLSESWEAPTRVGGPSAAGSLGYDGYESELTQCRADCFLSPRNFSQPTAPVAGHIEYGDGNSCIGCHQCCQWYPSDHHPRDNDLVARSERKSSESPHNPNRFEHPARPVTENFENFWTLEDNGVHKVIPRDNITSCIPRDHLRSAEGAYINITVGEARLGRQSVAKTPQALLFP